MFSNYDPYGIYKKTIFCFDLRYTKNYLPRFEIASGNIPVGYFTNIFQTTFTLISIWQKITNPNCKHIKAVHNILVQKSG